MAILDLWQKKEFSGIKPGLNRIKHFLNKVGNPHLNFKTIHISGTNGKGSTALFVSKILQFQNIKTGLFTSPHLIDLNERIKINSLPIKKNILNSLADKHLDTAEECKLTFFEYITGLAFIYFSNSKVDIAVVETGLGGRFDATNIIEKPLASILTDIDYDHVNLLGKSINKIAYEKSGIIKENSTVISGADNKTVKNIIRNTAKSKKSVLFEFSKDFSYTKDSINWIKKYQLFDYIGITNRYKVKLPLLGKYQLKNCCVALAAAEVLKTNGYLTKNLQINESFKNIRYPGRFDIHKIKLKKNKINLILDGAHNPHAIQNFIHTWKMSPWGYKKCSFIFGVLKDKNYKQMIKQLVPFVKNVILVPINSLRNTPIALLSKTWGDFLSKNSIMSTDSVNKALKMISNEKTIVITGSLYLVGEALKIIKKHEGK